MAAPSPKPAKLKLLEGRGNGRDSGGRKVSTGPAFKRVAPDKPDWLDPIAAAYWDEVLPELMRVELVKPVDQAGLAALCTAYAGLQHTSKMIRAEGLTVTNCNKDGVPIQTAPHPAVALQIKYLAALRSWCVEYGMTASAEQKVAKQVPDGVEEDNPYG